MRVRLELGALWITRCRESSSLITYDLRRPLNPRQSRRGGPSEAERGFHCLAGIINKWNTFREQENQFRRRLTVEP